MEVSARNLLVYFMALETYAYGLHLPRQFVAQGFYGENEENSKLEDMMDLSKPALHTLLKGLAALLVQLYPDIAPKPHSFSSEEKKEEPIKIFRQIMQIPGPILPPVPVPPMFPCQRICRQEQMQHRQPTQMLQDPPQNLQMPQGPPLNLQMPPQAPQTHPPQEPRPQQYSPLQNNQVTDQCFPTSPCFQQNIDPQQNPFIPEQFNTC